MTVKELIGILMLYDEDEKVFVRVNWEGCSHQSQIGSITQHFKSDDRVYDSVDCVEIEIEEWE